MGEGGNGVGMVSGKTADWIQKQMLVGKKLRVK
jgi:hypothetical protein